MYSWLVWVHCWECDNKNRFDPSSSSKVSIYCNMVEWWWGKSKARIICNVKVDTWSFKIWFQHNVLPISLYNFKNSLCTKSHFDGKFPSLRKTNEIVYSTHWTVMRSACLLVKLFTVLAQTMRPIYDKHIMLDKKLEQTCKT